MLKKRSGVKNKKNNRIFKLKPKKVLTVVGKGFLTFFLIGTITFSLIATALAIYVFGFVDSSVPFDLQSLKLDKTSIVYATVAGSDQPVELGRLHAAENRIWVDYNVMPQTLKDAFICIEDHRYLDHNGVDWKRTISSFANVFLKLYDSKQGGSTITQQLIKTITQEKEVSFKRKIQEIMRAITLEQRSSKDEIFEAYLNTIPLGSGCYGVQAAANYYFGKDVSELTLAECASLAAITRSPETYNPRKKPEENFERRNHVLKRMFELGKITEEEYQTAKAEELKTVPPAPQEYNSYYVDQVITDVVNDLIEKKGFDKIYAENLVYRGGLRIYTAMDKNIQEILESVYEDSSNFQKLKGEEQPQSAMVILDYNGRVVAMVGGRGEKQGNRVLNRATQSKRQPGSSLKPLSAYTQAIELNYLNYASRVLDEPITIVEDGESKLWPKNYSRTYSGETTLVNAIARSLNTVPVRICQDITPRHSFDFLTNKLHFTSLVSSQKINGKVYSDINLSAMGLGGVTHGVTVLELAAGYQIFGNGGFYNKPYTYTKVVDSNGNILLENKPVSTRAISSDTATIMNKLLQQVVLNPNGTGRSAKIGDMPVIGKTGTTSDDKDRWFVGATPYYVGVTWFGYDNPKVISGVSSNPALGVWKTVMNKVHSKMPVKDFNLDSNVVEQTYCIDSGGLATEYCKNVAQGWFKKDVLPEVCQIHVPAQETLNSVEQPLESSQSQITP